MKTFKFADFWLQIILIPACIFFSFFDHDFILPAYCMVGGWQLLSCLLHLAFRHHYYPAGDRTLYNKSIIWIFIIGIVSIPAWIIFGFILLLISPLLAIWYTWICYRENEVLKHKSLIHIK